MTCSYIELLNAYTPVIFDGAFGTQIQKATLSDADFNGHGGCFEMLNLSRPDIVRAIHVEYIEAGANVIETNTFGASRPKLREKGLDGELYAINHAAASLARQAVDRYIATGRHLCVCGSLGPTGYLPSSKDTSLAGESFDAIAGIYEEQAAALLDGGIDLLLFETAQDLLELRAGLYGVRRLLRKRGVSVALQVQATLDTSGRMLLGSDITAFLGAVASMGVSVVGLNCGAGPEELRPYAEQLLEYSGIRVSIQPNAGIPVNVNGIAVYGMEPDVFAGVLAPLVTEKGIAVVGGCCGTTPDHIRALARRLDGKSVARRTASRPACFCSTGISGVDLEAVHRPVIIGERLNTQGSKKTKELILARNWDELCQLALEQIGRGSALLDICVAVNERDDEKETMRALLSFLADRVAVPFSIDTTDAAVFETALRVCPGSALLNSINLENGGERARRVLSFARDFGCPVIALTIDDKGMADTIGRKLDLARALRDLACGEFGLPEHFVYVDPLVFTLATGEARHADAASTTLEALRRIKKEMPGVRTAMGVSNVSYGFSPPARRLLNNLLLHHAAEAGLDAAIFNPLHRDDIGRYDPEARRLGEDVLFNRGPEALRAFVTYYEAIAARKERAGAPGTAIPAARSTRPEDRLRRAIVDRDRREVPSAIEELLETHPAHHILDTVLLPAMAEVGERMASGGMILPFVLQAAEVMREALGYLEPRLNGEAGLSKGKIVLATVFGDVHDIGKNLVASILRNQGFEVIDLGKQVEIEAIVKAVREHEPDCVGLSALLVTTSRQMGECVREFARQGISVPLLIGGAAVNRDFASRIAKIEDGSVYAGNVYYGRDAFEAGKIIENVRKGSAGASSILHPRVEFAGSRESGASAASPLEYGPPPEPPFYGSSDLLRWDAKPLLDKIDATKLFKAWWSGGKLDADAYSRAEREEFRPSLEKIRSEIEREGLLDCAGCYGYFPVISDNGRIILLDPSDFHSELADFAFPRMPKMGGRSIADFVRPEGDVMAVQCVTIGRLLGERSGAYFTKENRYGMGYFLHGLGSYLVEELAGMVTKEIVRGLGLPDGTGRRYSFGYPGMPPLEEQKKIFELMAIEERLGITLTEGYQMVPEHSTLGICIHHPRSEYMS